jgi:hypothetical protein
MMRADNGRTMFCGKFRRDFPRNPAGLFIPRTECATDRIDYAALHFIYSFARQVFETKSASVFGKLMGERFGHWEFEVAIWRRMTRGQAPRRATCRSR